MTTTALVPAGTPSAEVLPPQESASQPADSSAVLQFTALLQDAIASADEPPGATPVSHASREHPPLEAAETAEPAEQDHPLALAAAAQIALPLSPPVQFPAVPVDAASAAPFASRAPAPPAAETLLLGFTISQAPAPASASVSAPPQLPLPAATDAPVAGPPPSSSVNRAGIAMEVESEKHFAPPEPPALPLPPESAGAVLPQTAPLPPLAPSAGLAIKEDGLASPEPAPPPPDFSGALAPVKQSLVTPLADARPRRPHADVSPAPVQLPLADARSSDVPPLDGQLAAHPTESLARSATEAVTPPTPAPTNSIRTQEASTPAADTVDDAPRAPAPVPPAVEAAPPSAAVRISRESAGQSQPLASPPPAVAASADVAPVAHAAPTVPSAPKPPDQSPQPSRDAAPSPPPAAQDASLLQLPLPAPPTARSKPAAVPAAESTALADESAPALRPKRGANTNLLFPGLKPSPVPRNAQSSHTAPAPEARPLIASAPTATTAEVTPAAPLDAPAPQTAPLLLAPQQSAGDPSPAAHAASSPDLPPAAQPSQSASLQAEHSAARAEASAQVVTGIHAARLVDQATRAEMQIAMRTAELGTIRLHTSLHDDSVQAAIGVERHDLLGVLHAGLPALAQNLAEQNLRVQALEVYLAPDHSAAGQPGADSGRRPHPHPATPHAAAGGSLSGAKLASHPERVAEDFFWKANSRLSVRA